MFSLPFMFMQFVYLVFWLSFYILIYTYLGYALLLMIFIIFKKQKQLSQDVIETTLPLVTVVVPSFNEDQWLAEKINNTLSLDYPSDRLKVIIITDGSTDNSNSIIAAYPAIQLLYIQERKGKMAAINRAMEIVGSSIVIFSDANTFLNKEAIRQLVKHYSNEKVGGVAGEKKVHFSKKNLNIGVGEGLYWKYESSLKSLDSKFNTVVGAAGELFSMRTGLFKPQAENIIADDFMLSIGICLKGFKVVYEPKAFATEAPSINLKEERKRRVRIAAGAFQCLFKLKRLLNIFSNPALSFQYISRRVLRWVCSPLCLILLFITDAVIVYKQPILNFYSAIFISQSLFYTLSFLGWLSYKMKMSISIFFVPYYFVFMNTSLIEGFFRYRNGSQTVLWDKSGRT